jgi:coenzyme F420-reducing hydrogenase alpha subunit
MIGDDDLISWCNLIVSTTHNNQAMNESVRAVARDLLSTGVRSPKGCSTTSKWPSAPTTPA